MVDYSKNTVPELKALCEKEGVAKTGKKEELIQRLVEKDNEKKSADAAASAKPPTTAANITAPESAPAATPAATVGTPKKAASKPAAPIATVASPSKPAAKSAGASSTTTAAVGATNDTKKDTKAAVTKSTSAIKSSDPASITAVSETATKPTDTKTTATKATAAKTTTTATKPTEVKPTDTKSTETKPTDPKTTEAKYAEVKPAKDYSAGLAATDLEKELEARKKRETRFGKVNAVTGEVSKIDEADKSTEAGKSDEPGKITEGAKTDEAAKLDTEADKLLKRLKKFGPADGAGVKEGLSRLDQALPERRQKRGRGAENEHDDKGKAASQVPVSKRRRRGVDHVRRGVPGERGHQQQRGGRAEGGGVENRGAGRGGDRGGARGGGRAVEKKASGGFNAADRAAMEKRTERFAKDHKKQAEA